MLCTLFDQLTKALWPDQFPTIHPIVARSPLVRGFVRRLHSVSDREASTGCCTFRPIHSASHEFSARSSIRCCFSSRPTRRWAVWCEDTCALTFFKELNIQMHEGSVNVPNNRSKISHPSVRFVWFLIHCDSDQDGCIFRPRYLP